MNRILLYCVLLTMAGTSVRAADPPITRPPAVPLVTCDPYFSIWSTADSLHRDWTRHWTGATQALTSLLRVDGTTYRLMGKDLGVPMLQRSVSVMPTRTAYAFEGGGLAVQLVFTTPLIPSALDLASRPITYLTWEIRSTDGRQHDATLYLEATAEAAVNTPDQKVTWGRFEVPGLDLLAIGSQDQRVLEKKGDNLRIDWGRFLLAARKEPGGASVFGDAWLLRDAFLKDGTLPAADDLDAPRSANDGWPSMARSWKLGPVGPQGLSRMIVLAYDDRFSIQYFQRNLRPYWRRNGQGSDSLVIAAFQDADRNIKACDAFDREVMADLERAGGPGYAALAALAYRQCLAANKIVADIDGTPLMFPKENFSNGCIGTVDVIYPASPFFLLFSPAMLKAQLTPLLDYASLPRWKFPFAPHDLGTYPHANGQVYGGGEQTEEDQMPVEETGNMLLMMAALAHVDGNAAFAQRYWPVLGKWAAYLKEKGLDPENQLCTDDFAGHLAHNTNLSLKAILALGGYAKLCEIAGKRDDARAYRRTAEAFAAQWQKMAADGDHYRLTFDQPGTWSQKYNLVWDEILGLTLFPPDVRRTEVRFYLGKQNRFGLPLDNRKAYTKLDWTVWSATLAESPGDFRALIDPLVAFANATPDRVPLSDWFWTTDARHVGFQARSVVGGVFVKMLADPGLWKKWSSRR